MIVLQTIRTGPDPCTYLPDRQATMENLVVVRLSGQEYEQKMNEGWRKFGPVLFRPICDGCQACRPLRIPVAEFAPSRSQRRAQAKNAELTVTYARPTVDATRLALYNRYHGARERTKGWAESEKSEEDYVFSFLQNPVTSVEISVWEEATLLAIVLADITPNTVSGVYHYYEPEEAGRSLGTFVMLQTIELARKLEKPWAYFGYWVAACPSLSYKANFRPCEIFNTDRVWQRLLP
jgi:leucyl-tRNA---protein transferase